ncbi:MAG: DivIVA domain-containing protein [Actinomycetota bacterium]
MEQRQPTSGTEYVKDEDSRPRLITPVDVQQMVFRLAFRGYNEHDVDDFLDHITEDLAGLHEENKRLREALTDAQAAATPVPLTAHQQAEETVRRAREHAARLLEEAEGRAAAQAAKAPSWFLIREREFLRRLASLIQEHADSLKRQAKGEPEKPEEQPSEGQPPAPSEEALEAAMLAGGQGETTLEQAQPPLEEPEPVYSDAPEPSPPVLPQAVVQPPARPPVEGPQPPAPEEGSARALTPSEEFAAPISRGPTGPPHPWDLSHSSEGPQDQEGPGGEEGWGSPLPEAALPEIEEEVEPRDFEMRPEDRPVSGSALGSGVEQIDETSRRAVRDEGEDHEEGESDDEPSLRELFWGEE